MEVIKPEEEVWKEFHEKLGVMKLASIQDNFHPTKETIVELIVGPTMLHTKLSTLTYQIQMD